MKYYSEKLGKLFDTEEKLREEEKTNEDKATKFNEELDKLRDDYRCALFEVRDAQNAIYVAYKKMQKTADAYKKKLAEKSRIEDENTCIKNDFFYNWVRNFHEDN